MTNLCRNTRSRAHMRRFFICCEMGDLQKVKNCAILKLIKKGTAKIKIKNENRMHNSTREHFFRSLMSVTAGILVLSTSIFSSVSAQETSIARATQKQAMKMLEENHESKKLLDDDREALEEAVVWQKTGRETEGYVSSTKMQASSTDFAVSSPVIKTEKEKANESRVLKNFTQRLKRADKQVEVLSRQWIFSKKQASVDATDAIADGDALFAAMKDARTTAVDAIQHKDISKAKLIIENEIIGRFDDVRAVMQRIDAMKNPKTFAKTISLRLKENNQTIDHLKSLGKDTGDVEEIFKELQQKQKDLRSKIVGSADFKKAVNDFTNTNQIFAEAAAGTEDIGR